MARGYMPGANAPLKPELGEYLPSAHEWREIATPGGSRWACVCGAGKPSSNDSQEGSMA